MSILLKFASQFNLRHDFNKEELVKLQTAYPNISFSNIPVAWIVPLDNMLLQLNKNCISAIRQLYGNCIIVKSERLSKKHLQLIKKCEADIKAIDFDLFEQFGLIS